MTETEVADIVMEVLGFDHLEKRIVEVEAGNSMKSLEIEVEGGQRFELTVAEIPA